MLFFCHDDNKDTINNFYEDWLEDFSEIKQIKRKNQIESDYENIILNNIVNIRSNKYKKLISDLNKSKKSSSNTICRRDQNCQKKSKS